MVISAQGVHFSDLNQKVRESKADRIELTDVYGHRYIGSGLDGKTIEISGTPGNALGAYLNGAKITVKENAQDATGDTMNDGEIVIHGSSGDATGYAMRGGKIFIRGSAGYRCGIHMKEYKSQKPVIVLGETAGDFLGEYQAGGIIIVLGLGCSGIPFGNFATTGMHGGKMFIRSKVPVKYISEQVVVTVAKSKDIEEIRDYLEEFCGYFDVSMQDILKEKFYIITPNTKNPYKQLYTHN